MIRRVEPLRTIMFAILVAIAFTPLVVTPQTLFPFVFGKALAIRVAAAVLALCLAALISVGGAALGWTPIAAAVVTYLATAAVSVLTSIDPSLSLVGEIERMGGFYALLAYAVIFAAARTVLDRDRAVTFAKAAIAAGLLESAYTFLQFAGAEFVWPSQDRPDGSFGNAAMLAGYMLFVMGLAVIVIVEASRLRSRIYGAAAFSAATVTILISGTRGAALGVYAAVLIAAVGARAISEERRAKRRATVAALLLIALPCLFVAYPARSAAAHTAIPLMGRFARTSLADRSTQARVQLARISWRAVQDRPLTGWGLETFRVPFNRYFDPQWLRLMPKAPIADKPHNKLLEVAVESGVLGLLGYLSIVLAVLWTIRRAVHRAPAAIRWSLVALGALWSAYFVQNLFFFDFPLSCALAAILLAVTDRWGATNAHPLRTAPASRWRRAAVAVPLAVAAFALISYDARAWTASVVARRAASQTSPDEVIADIDAAFREGTYVEEFARRLAAGPVVEGLRVEPGIQQPALVRYVENALQRLEEGRVRAPLDLRVVARLGELYNWLGPTNPLYYYRAEAAVRAALSLSPNRPDLYYELARAYGGEGRIREAAHAADVAAVLMRRAAVSGQPWPVKVN